jgi:hypothetical protein
MTVEGTLMARDLEGSVPDAASAPGRAQRWDGAKVVRIDWHGVLI